MAKPAEPNAKNWCFTLHYDGVYESDGLPRPTEAEALLMIEDLQEYASYIVYGFEVAPQTGQKHLQGYVQLNQKMRRSALAKILPRTHLLVAKGNDEDNFTYCTKSGKFEEFGERRDTTGGRLGAEKQVIRWKIAREAAIANDLTLVDDQLFVQHYSCLKAIAKDHMVLPDDANDVTGVWIWGPPGVGKSRRARADYPGAYKKLCNKWWDGYNPNVHKVAIMDDIGMEHSMLAYHLKIWCDRYAFLAETKGGAIAIRPEKFVITSNYSIEEIFGDGTENAKAIRRRCHVTHMDEPFRALTTVKQGISALSAEPQLLPDTPLISGPKSLPHTTASSSSRALMKLERTDTLPLDESQAAVDAVEATPTRSDTPHPQALKRYKNIPETPTDFDPGDRPMTLAQAIARVMPMHPPKPVEVIDLTMDSDDEDM